MYGPATYTGVYNGEALLSSSSTSWLGAPFNVPRRAATVSIISKEANTPNANVNGAFPNATQANGHSAWQSLGLSGLFGGNRQTEQFILGLLLGGAAAYVLGDPEKRAKLIRMGMKLYAGVAGSVEEFKEQIADLKAEVAAEQENAED